MVDRYRIWLGAGVLAGGVSAAMLAGTGVAVADDGSSPGSGTQATSDTGRDTQTASNSKEPDASPKPDSDAGASTESDSDAGDTAESDTAESDTDGEAQETPVDDPDADTGQEQEVQELDAGQKPSGGKHRAPEPEEDLDIEVVADEPAVEVQPETPAASGQEAGAEQPADETVVDTAAPAPLPSTFVQSVDTDLGSYDGAAVMRMAAIQAPPLESEKPTLLDVFNNIGRAIYNFYTNTMQFLAGPIRVPLGSHVRVETSTVAIGDGHVARADWYFPTRSTPTRLIYLQHGVLADGSFYSATAAYLAEKTNSIVVVPTLTWNVFDVESYPLELPTTGRAIADLFSGDRAALNASAQAAGYVGVLPTKFVLVGHSAGGGLIAMVARNLAEQGNIDDLAGVVMLDGVGTMSPMTLDLAGIPRSVPLYNIAGEPNSWNLWGDTTRRLDVVRPAMFTGIKMNGGGHADGMQSTSMALQMVAYLATGFSSPLDVTATRVLAAGWINDMFAGTRTPYLYSGSGNSRAIVAAWRLSTMNDRKAALRARTVAV